MLFLYDTMMKLFFSTLLCFFCLTLHAQKFTIHSENVEGNLVETQGEITVDVEKASILINLNGRQIFLKKVSFRKGDIGELIGYKETIDNKLRIVFSPNKDRKGNRRKVSHTMTYTVVASFSGQKTILSYNLIKRRR